MQLGTTTPKVRFFNYAPGAASLHERIVRGLKQPEKRLPSFLLYDARGIRLFDRLIGDDDYSTARCESRLLNACGQELRRLVGNPATVVEYGSGTGRTAVALLGALQSVAAYMPVDLSLSSLKLTLRRVRRAAGDINMVPVRADFTSCFAMPAVTPRPARILVYLSSCAFSALDRAAAARLLQGAIQFCGHRGRVLLGVDLRKLSESKSSGGARPRDDSVGPQRALESFNLNLLAHVNRRYAANFRREGFAHAVVANQADCRTELRLESLKDQIVKIDRRKVRLRYGDSILTEARQRYGWADVEASVRVAGGTFERAWLGDDRSVALCLVRPDTRTDAKRI
ncbi:MAG: L-histidine N(alpha)-methyltransferase [Gammaproteobacteria bacterium]